MPPRKPAAIVVSYVAAALLPVTAYILPPQMVMPFLAYLYFLVIILIARLVGFGQALVATAVSAFLLWETILSSGVQQPRYVQVMRVVLFIVVCVVNSGLTRARSQSDERYRRLIQLAPDGIYVADERGRISFANKPLAQLSGRENDALIGTPLEDLFAPHQRADLRTHLQRLAESGAMPIVTATLVRPDGSTVDVQTAAIPVHENGRVLAQGFVRDITQEARLADSRQRMQALFDTAIDAIFFADEMGKYLDVNAAASDLTGYSREELLQMRVGDLAPAASAGEFQKVWSRLMDQRSLSGEFTIRRKDGKLREVEYRIVGQVLPNLHCAFVHDISRRKEAERSLHQLSAKLLRLQDEERRRIARQLHETTAQSLAALRLSLSLIAQSADGQDKRAREALRDSIALADQSIVEVRTLSYLLHPPLIDEMGLVAGLRWYVKGFETRSGIAVTLDAPEELERLPVEAETAVFRVIQEALTNIQRHSGSTIAHIRLEGSTDELRVTIEDEGHGLPSHLRGNIEALSAAGVGVAGMRERVRELGGEMDIESNERGTRIAVRLSVPKERP